MEAPLERAPMGVLAVAPDGTVRAVNDAAADLLAIDAGAASGEPIASVFPDSMAATVPAAFDSPPETERSVEEYYPAPDLWLNVTLVPAGDEVYVYVRDATADHRREQRVDALEGDLDRVTITNELISTVLAELVTAPTRDDVAETICERLGETDIYEFAWVGERAVGSDDVVMSASAGTTTRTLSAIETALSGNLELPEARAVETGEPQIIQALGEDDAVPESIRRAAFADGLQSLLAVPLTYGDSVYGVVGVYTADRSAFTERERASFATVGEMAGFAINATRHRTLLLSDTVVELTVQVTDPAAPFVRAAREHDATLSVNAIVPQADRYLCYVAAENAAPEQVATTLSESEPVTATRVVATDDDAGSLEATLGEATPLGRLVSRGATVQSGRFTAAGGRIVVDLPPDEDVRRIAESVTRRYDADVIAKRERERDERSDGEFRDALDDRLTDHQEQALRTAFFADYFESPRGSTAEEVADALGITGPTLLHHLRAGQRKLLAEFFETTDD